MKKSNTLLNPTEVTNKLKMEKRKVKLVFYAIALLLSAYIFYIDSWFHELSEEYTLVKSIVGFILFYTIVNIGSLLAKWSYSRRQNMLNGQKNNVHYGIENIARFLIGIGIITTILGSIGIQLWELITSITIVATAIAILTKEYISDFLVGIHLSFSNIFEVGDFVKLGDQVGEVVGINMLKTLVKDENDDILMLPNTKVHYNEIINYTKKNIRVMNINFEIGIEYIAQIEQLHKNITEAVLQLSKDVDPNSCHLQILNIHNDYMDVKFQYKLKKVNLSSYSKIRRTVINEAFKYLKTYK